MARAPIMLSAETSAGKHPIEAVRMMARIACETESSIQRQGFLNAWENSPDRTMPEIIADAAYHCARTAGVVALAVGTTSGSFGAPAGTLPSARPDLRLHIKRELWRANSPSFMEWRRLSPPK